MIIEKSIIKGRVEAPKSKSYAHRLIIASFLSCQDCEINGIELSSDILATLNALKSVGLKYNIVGDKLYNTLLRFCTFHTKSSECKKVKGDEE